MFVGETAFIFPFWNFKFVRFHAIFQKIRFSWTRQKGSTLFPAMSARSALVVFHLAFHDSGNVHDETCFEKSAQIVHTVRAGLPSRIDTCCSSNRSAVDDLDVILAKAEGEQARRSAQDVEQLLTDLIDRAIASGAAEK